MINGKDIKDQPLTTNKIKVSVDMDRFLSMYSIVSYYSLDKKFKNLAYEQLADTPCLSVTGIRARWNKSIPYTKFFILVEKGKSTEVLKSLRSYDTIRSQEESLTDYSDKQKERIIASLAINSLGKTNKGKMMYNDGSLLLCDDKNFLIPKSRKELVCLKIEINEFMNLNAKTTSFSNPKNKENLLKNCSCVFQASQDIYGQWWSGLAIKPVVVRHLKDSEINLENLYIKHKKFSDNHNIVPFWPYNPENYTHGKLFAIAQVMSSVNEKYRNLIKIEFVDFETLHFDQCQSKKAMLACIMNYFKGRKISFEDPFDSEASKKFIYLMKGEIGKLMEQSILFSEGQEPNDLRIKLVEPKEENAKSTLYTQSTNRMNSPANALQHVVFYNNEKEDTFSEAEARRFLIELLVKDSLIKKTMPSEMAEKVKDWEFLCYKINQGNVIGASLSVGKNENIQIRDFGFSSQELPYDFDSFVSNELKYDDKDKINGSREYMAIKKDGNVFIIIDTDEIPILDVSLIDDGYAKIFKGEKPLAFFKRKDEVHKYLRGYVGFHLWKSDGMDGEPEGSYSYIVGTNNDSLQIKNGTKMDRMPRARRIFILHKEHPELVESQIIEISGMLKLGLGRWNEMMTYPFPFKFLREYLDNASETVFCIHWNEINSKTDLIIG